MRLLSSGDRRRRTRRASPAGCFEAYSRCVADGQAQLATSYRNAMEFRAREPAVRERMRQSLVRDCRDGLDR
jgi:hypothetical protein